MHYDPLLHCMTVQRAQANHKLTNATTATTLDPNRMVLDLVLLMSPLEPEE